MLKTLGASVLHADFGDPSHTFGRFPRAPKSTNGTQKRFQEGQMSPRKFQRCHTRFQEDPREAPSGAMEAPRKSQGAQKEPQGAPARPILCPFIQQNAIPNYHIIWASVPRFAPLGGFAPPQIPPFHMVNFICKLPYYSATHSGFAPGGWLRTPRHHLSYNNLHIHTTTSLGSHVIQ